MPHEVMVFFRRTVSVIAIAVFPMLAAGATPAIGTASVANGSHAKIEQQYGKLPLTFEANHGQADSQVKFLSHGDGYGLYLTSQAAVLFLHQPSTARLSDDTRRDTVRMRLAGSNPNPNPAGAGLLPGVANYFVGNDPAKWQTEIPTFAKVRYTDVYPGVDLVYYGNQSRLEYDFLLAPGADPNRIRLSFDGARKLKLNPNGDLVIAASHGELSFQKPVIYQTVDGAAGTVRTPVVGSFRLMAGNTVGFVLGSYDHARPLVIDPVLVYSTYLGGTSFTNNGNAYDTQGNGIAVDADGAAYTVGSTYSSDFPVTSGAYRVHNTATAANNCATIYISKLNASGTALEYSTYLGGATGSPAGDYGQAIAVDGQKNVYVTGYSYSADFPTTAGSYRSAHPTIVGSPAQSVFVTKLNASGTALAYSTFVGQGAPIAIAVDASGDAYLTGQPYSYDFPVTAGAFQPSTHNSQNIFVTKVNPSGSDLLYSTFLGGTGYSVQNYPIEVIAGDIANAIAVDSTGNAYVTGGTYSSDFPVTAGAYQTTYPGSDPSPQGPVLHLVFQRICHQAQSNRNRPGVLHLSGRCLVPEALYAGSCSCDL